MRGNALTRVITGLVFVWPMLAVGEPEAQTIDPPRNEGPNPLVQQSRIPVENTATVPPVQPMNPEADASPATLQPADMPVDNSMAPVYSPPGEVYGQVFDPGMPAQAEPGYGQAFDQGYGSAMAPGFGQPYEPGLLPGYDPVYGQVPDPGYGPGFDPAWGQAYEPVYGQPAGPGYLSEIPGSYGAVPQRYAGSWSTYQGSDGAPAFRPPAGPGYRDDHYRRINERLDAILFRLERIEQALRESGP